MTAMYKARYYKEDGKKGNARGLPDTLFDGVVNEGVMHQVVRAYLLNQRQGTAAAKSRSEVQATGSKPFRQKGTGRARQGFVRAAQMEGGGRAFPPIPHSWRQRVPKKVKALARRSALNDRAENDRVVMVDMPSMDAPKTQSLVAFLASIEVEGKVLILTNGKNDNVYLSARNLSNVSVMPFGGESVYDVLWANIVVIERSALEDGEKAAPKAKAKAKAKAAPKAKAKAEPEAEAAAEVVEEAPKAKAAEAAPEAEAEVAPEAEADAPVKNEEGDDA